MPLDRRLSEIPFVALDLEATGVAHGHDRIVEVGAARFTFTNEGKVVPGATFRRLVDPDLAIPEIVSRLTGIDDEMVRGKPALADVWPTFVAFLTELPGTVAIAHAARSDMAYLVSDARRFDLDVPRVPFVCTLQVSRRAFPNAGGHGLDRLIAHLSGEPQQDRTFHRALADALHTRNLFSLAVNRIGARRLPDLGVTKPVAWPKATDFDIEVPARLEPLVGAIAGRERVLIVYRGGSKGRRTRPMTPLAFFSHRGVPFLRAWCHLDDSAKSFRCDRIVRVVAAVDDE